MNRIDDVWLLDVQTSYGSGNVSRTHRIAVQANTQHGALVKAARYVGRQWKHYDLTGFTTTIVGTFRVHP